MISHEITKHVSPDIPHGDARPRYKRKNLWKSIIAMPRIMLVCLFLACLGASWFTYQLYLVPQPDSFTPDWQGAKWIGATDGKSSVAYFRYVTSLETQPEGAFITIAASQVFYLSVNGYAVGTNFHDFEKGYFPRTYMYDLDSLLQPGPNVFAVLVSNFDEQVPALQASIGFVQGKSTYYTGTGTRNGNAWRATINSENVFPHYSTSVYTGNLWTTTHFVANSWLPAQAVTNAPASSLLAVNPLLYEQPVSTHWMSAGAGHDAYFVRRFSLPLGITNVWLRVVAAGNTDIYINGHLSIVWNGQPILKSQNISQYLSDNQAISPYRSGLVMGVYDITPFLQAGENTIAVHVVAPAASLSQEGLAPSSDTLSLDMLVNDFLGHQEWLPSGIGWRASTSAVDNWVQGSNAALAWPTATAVGRPGASTTSYVQDNTTPLNVQVVPFTRIVELILLCTGLVVGLWLLVSLVVMRRYFSIRSNALETMSLAYVPALACEVLLVVLSQEPGIPQPFPYNWQWASILVVLVGVGYFSLWLYARAFRQQIAVENTLSGIAGRDVAASQNSAQTTMLPNRYARITAMLRAHWPLFLIILLAIPLISYNLSYDPYWQDELTSFYAAKGILAHGFPAMPSGFIYPKGELYHYVLALFMSFFGDQNGVPRLLSVIEYLVSLPVCYIVGSYFFERRIALLATAMLAFSPMALTWGRQMRMYEQAQLCTMLAIYLIYRAIDERDRVILIYLAVASLVCTYLSHEETFIILPAIVSWVLVKSKDEKHRAFAVLYQKHWWIAGALGATIIMIQLLAVHFTHPAILGTDQSQVPFIQFTTVNVPYYLKLLFAPWTLGRILALPILTVNSGLATIGCILAARQSDDHAKYCCWFLALSFFTLILIFTLSDDRYLYPILPVYYFMGAYALLTALRMLGRFVDAHVTLSRAGRSRITTLGNPLSFGMRAIVVFSTSLLLASVLILPTLPLNNYNLFVSRAFNLPYHRHYPDYDGVEQYMQQHWKPGDIVISIFPAISILYYVGHNDYFFSVDRALYLFEKDGQITDTPTGSKPLLNQADFNTVLATHAHIWIISDNGSYQSQVQGRFTFPPGFHQVYRGYQSAIYLGGG